MKYFTNAAWLAGVALAASSGVGAVWAQAPAAPNPAPQTQPQTQAQAQPQARQPEAAPFDILEYEVAGNSVLSVAAIEKTVTPFLGPGRSMADVESARAALEKAYQGAGFLTVFVDVPEQRVSEGVVRLQVLEGRIERLMVVGSRYYSQGYIREKVAELEEGRVPNFNSVQQELAVVNRNEQRRVQPVLRPGKTPGTVEVELKVEDQVPVTGSVELNNGHSADTDPWRLNASLRYENLWQRDHSFALTGIVAPREPSQAKVLVGTYSVPMDNGNSLIGYVVSSDSTVATLGGTNVLGDGTTYGLRYAIPFAASGGSTHSLSLGLDYKDVSEKVATAGGVAISTPLRYMPFQAAYTGSWLDRGQQTQLSATFVFAARQLFNRYVDCAGIRMDQFACKRSGADGSFATLRADLRHTQSFGWGSISGRVAGQIATQPLASSAEQFTVGGADTVRGYLESEGSGDEGLLGSLEVRSPNFGPALSDWAGSGGKSPLLGEVSAHAFLDAARVRTLQPLPEQQSRVPLLGSGFGLRVASRQGLTSDLDFAWAHKATRSTSTGDVRVHFRLGLKF